MRKNIVLFAVLKAVAASLLIAFLCAAVPAPDAGAQTYYSTTPSPAADRSEGRAGTWDIFFPLTYMPSSSWDGPFGSNIDTDATWGFGFGGGYNFSEHFQLNGIFSWSARNYTATAINSDNTPRVYGNTMYTSTFSLNGVVYFLKGKISPFLSGGIGMTYVDTSIQTAPGQTACWWDPWYGYICSNSAPTKTENDLSYNVGAGVRIDVTPRFSLQPSYNRLWIDISNASNTPHFDVWRLDFIYRMP